jgi:beta-galactosidase
VSAWPYSQEALDEARHTHELPDTEQNTVNIDLKQMGVGGNDSWSLKAMPLPAYQIQPEPMNYSFWIKPLSGEERDPAQLARKRIL